VNRPRLGARPIKAERTPLVIVRLYHQQSPKPAIKGRAAEGPDQSRNRPLSQALIGPRDLKLSAVDAPAQAAALCC